MVDPTSFIQITRQCSEKWLSHCTSNPDMSSLIGNGQRVYEESVLQICKYIGNSQVLFSKFATMCVKHTRPQKVPTSNDDSTSTPYERFLWCNLLRHLLINITRDKIKRLGKLRDLAWQLNNFLRESNLNKNSKKGFPTDRIQLSKRLEVNNKVISDIFNDVADIKRVFVATYERMMGATTQNDAVNQLPHGSKPRSRGSRSKGSDRVLTFDEKLLACWSEISKMDKQNIFGSPVTEDIAPNYYSVVKQPMDLGTMKKKLPSEYEKNNDDNVTPYSTVDEFEADLKLMFDNCILYNMPSSPIAQKALKLWQAWLKNKPTVFGIESSKNSLTLNTTPILPAAPVPPPPRIVVKSTLIPPKRQTAAIDNDEENNSAEKLKLPSSKPEGKLNSSQDAPLKMSIKIKKSAKASDGQLRQNKRPTINNAPLRTILKKAIEYIWRVESDVKVNGPEAGLFSKPVTEDVAPQYFSIIKYPMDLSTLRKRVTSGGYKSVDEFEKDLKLIFDNCREYNGPDHLFCKIGNNLWDFWTANRPMIEANPDIPFEELVQPQSVTEPVHHDAGRKKKKLEMKQKASGMKDTLSSANIEKDMVSRANGDRKAAPSSLIKRKKVSDDRISTDGSGKMNDADNKNASSHVNSLPKAATSEVSTSQPSSSTDKQEFKKNNHSENAKIDRSKLDLILNNALEFIWKVESDSTVNGPNVGLFSSPVTDEIAPGYSSTIKHPMDLSTIEKKISSKSYQTVDEFSKDIKLMLDNCKEYNDPDSVYYEIADNLWKFWESNRTKIEKDTSITYEKLAPPSVVAENVPERPYPELSPITKKINIDESHLLHEALERSIEFISTEDDTKLFATDVSVSRSQLNVLFLIFMVTGGHSGLCRHHKKTSKYKLYKFQVNEVQIS